LTNPNPNPTLYPVVMDDMSKSSRITKNRRRRCIYIYVNKLK